MNAMKIVLAAVFLSLLIAPVLGAEYVGSDRCKTCHKDIWEDFMKTGHPYKLRPVDEARQGNEEFGIRKVTELPNGYTWDDITYVIGGVWWKTRFVNETGYIVTGNAVQYNLETGQWVPYDPDEVAKPYNCGKCHTTGYNEDGHQDGLPGIVGTWAFPGIECEACHGPASEHVANPTEVKPEVDTSSALCGKCHVRGDPSRIPASNGFIKHHEQYNELLASPHKDLSCITCHDPHKSVKNPMVDDAIKMKCEQCHGDVAKEFAESEMAKEGVECTDCHMPFAAKSAVKRAEFEGDIRSHLFRINTDPSAPMFTDDGKYTAGGYLTLDFACLYCHTDKDREWAAKYAVKAHKFEEEEPKPTPTATATPTPEKTATPEQTPTKEKQKPTPGFEVLGAVAALLGAIYLLGRRR
ncbi:cytochrome c3 family protein [Geoglobus acetivorans]|uniref:PGF-CTERM sorting domain-containing protein n=1 Tax=Geoglobus acetivorans TaxID=565033 RepID=A0ABZ3H6W2_GEOAI|nr:PGF-CTERM sorting domain-containing protein [Geoglobus acetivorans]